MKGTLSLLAVTCLASCASVQEADHLFAAGRYAEALDVYRDVDADERRRPETSLRIGIALHQLGRCKVAPIYLTRASNAPGGHRERLWYMADCRMRQGRHTDAIRAFRELLDGFDDGADVHNNLGLAYLLNGQSGAAVDQMESALRKIPGHVHARRNLDRLRASSAAPATLDAWHYAPAPLPQRSGPTETVGALEGSTGGSPAPSTKARGGCGPAPTQQLGDSDRSDHRQLGQLARCHLHANDPRAAARLYREAIRGSPTTAAHHLGLGWALLALEQIDQAEQVLFAALEVVDEPEGRQRIDEMLERIR